MPLTFTMEGAPPLLLCEWCGRRFECLNQWEGREICDGCYETLTKPRCWRCHYTEDQVELTDYDDGHWICVPCTEYLVYRRRRESQHSYYTQFEQRCANCPHRHKPNHDANGTCRAHSGHSGGWCMCLGFEMRIFWPWEDNP